MPISTQEYEIDTAEQESIEKTEEAVKKEQAAKTESKEKNKIYFDIIIKSGFSKSMVSNKLLRKSYFLYIYTKCLTK